MRRITYDKPLAAEPALRRYNPTHTYDFRMPSGRWSIFAVSFIILGTPGIIYLITYRGGAPSLAQVVSLTLLAVIIAGLASKFLANRVILDPEELIIRKDHHDFFVRLYDIEDAFLAESPLEVDTVPLPDGHYPMEFEDGDRNIVVLVLKDGTVSRSSSKVRDGIPTKLVSFNVSRPMRFLAFLRMRV